MNRALRHVAVVTAVMFALLFGSTSVVQFFAAKSLNESDLNSRVYIEELARERGPILVDGTPIAYSEPSDDVYEYQRKYGAEGMSPEAYAAVTGFFSVTSGASGIERAENGMLSGTDDALFYDKVRGLLTGEKPMGAAVQLTINPKAQQAAYDGLGGQRGAVAAIDPKTGNILALVSTPGFDPNELATHDREQAQASYDALIADDANPAYNRAIGGNLYPPGSTFKIVTAAAAIESGQYTEDSEVPGPASLTLPQTTATISNSNKAACGPGDSVTLKRALVISCNTAFAHLGMELGEDAMREQADAFGFDERMEIPLTTSASTFPADLNPPQLAQSAIGQYDVRATPLQMAMVSGAVANGGVVMKPQLIDQVRSARTLSLISDPGPQELRRAMSEDTARQLTDMMTGVVSDGTGGTAQISGVDVAGKTGTAQHAQGAAPHAWFTSFAPADDPQVAVAVIVESGGSAGNEASGGRVAGPIARDVMEAVISG